MYTLNLSIFNLKEINSGLLHSEINHPSGKLTQSNLEPESNDDDDIDPTEVLNDSEKKTVFDSFEQLISDVTI